jgi:hypothetical protein
MFLESGNFKYGLVLAQGKRKRFLACCIADNQADLGYIELFSSDRRNMPSERGDDLQAQLRLEHYLPEGSQSKFYYATSKALGGPWSKPPSLMTGEHLTHDFDIAVGPDGAHYILTDTWANTMENQAPGHSVPVWDIYVQKLAPNLTSTVGSNSTSKLIRAANDLYKQGLNLEACGFFYHDSYWYQTYSYTCQNCPGYIYYLYAKDPLGPYTDGGYISLDGCGGQNKGANVLPSAKGPTVLAGNLAYRTSPTNHVLKGQI